MQTTQHHIDNGSTTTDLKPTADLAAPDGAEDADKMGAAPESIRTTHGGSRRGQAQPGPQSPARAEDIGAEDIGQEKSGDDQDVLQIPVLKSKIVYISSIAAALGCIIAFQFNLFSKPDGKKPSSHSISAPGSMDQHGAPFDRLVNRLFAATGGFSRLDSIDLNASQSAFKPGDAMHFSFKAPCSAHAWVLYLTTAGQLIQLFPNRFNPDSHIDADVAYRIPPMKESLTLEADGPAGVEKMVMLIADEPIGLNIADYADQPFYVIEPGDLFGINEISAQLDRLQPGELKGKIIHFSLL